MKKINLVLILSALSILPTLAQSHYRSSYQSRTYRSSRYTSRWNTYDRETYLGLRVGLAVASVHSDDPELDGGSGQSGFNVGMVGGIQLTDATPLFLEVGLYYTEKGGKGYHGGDKFTYGLNYLEFPIVVKYKYFFDDALAIQPFFGGFLACGVGGKIKNYGAREAFSSFSGDYFKRFDGGLRLGCGFSFTNLYLELAYDFGLANICHDMFDKSHTGCFYATLGVDF